MIAAATVDGRFGDGAGRGGECDGVAVARGVFERNDAIGAGGEDGAGHDFDAGVGGVVEFERAHAGGLRALNPKFGDAGGDGGGAEREAVHRNPIEGR